VSTNLLVLGGYMSVPYIVSDFCLTDIYAINILLCV